MIRFLKNKDIRAVEDLYFEFTGERHKLETLNDLVLAWGDSATFVYVDDHDVPIGIATINIMEYLTQGYCKAGIIDNVVVKTTERGKGVGKALVDALIEYAKTIGCYKLTLICNDNNVLFYQKCGLIKQNNSMRINLFNKEG